MAGRAIPPIDDNKSIASGSGSWPMILLFPIGVAIGSVSLWVAFSCGILFIFVALIGWIPLFMADPSLRLPVFIGVSLLLSIVIAKLVLLLALRFLIIAQNRARVLALVLMALIGGFATIRLGPFQSVVEIFTVADRFVPQSVGSSMRAYLKGEPKK